MSPRGEKKMIKINKRSSEMGSAKADISQEHNLMNANSSNQSLNITNSQGNTAQLKAN